MRRALALSGLVTSAILCACESKPDPAIATLPVPVASPTPALPAEWTGKTNPLPNDVATIERGRAAFLTNCAPCHGPEADGKGVASTGLNPPPANFRDGHRLSSKGDDYLFWRISTGITGTAMPAFDGTLSAEDRWAILRFLRSLPGAEARPVPSPERT